MAPTYFRREPGIDVSNGHRGSALSSVMPDLTETQSPKAALRTAALALRDALPAEQRAAAAEKIAARKFPVAVKAGTIVSGFMPLKSEINPLPLLRKLGDAGAQLALPTIAGRGKPLIMRAYKFGDEFARGQWGIREPKPDAAEVVSDILIVPLAAFDRAGHRIGYGAGYYDMTIRALRARKPVIAIGIAFAVQEIPRVPATERDERLDLVLTEREVIDLRKL
jgi:5-formyltetrahydrofolate cyclo-ligase